MAKMRSNERQTDNVREKVVDIEDVYLFIFHTCYSLVLHVRGCPLRIPSLKPKINRYSMMKMKIERMKRR